MSFYTKRIYDPPGTADGQRILVDRLWPRGVSKDRAKLDLWMKDVAPSPALRTWFDHREDRFAEFKDRYREELATNPAVAELCALGAKKRVSLLYAAADAATNHAVVLKAFLERAPRARAAKKRR